MNGHISIKTNVIRTALEAECTKCSLSFVEGDTNADLCTKIDNYYNS